MKMLATMLAAACLVAGTSLALAGGDTTAKPGISKRGDDTNPTVPNANPATGNASYMKAMHSKHMKSARVSATHKRSKARGMMK